MARRSSLPHGWLRSSSGAGCWRWRGSGYRATDEWHRSAALLAEHRGQQAADVLDPRADRDMQGAQTSILNSPEENREALTHLTRRTTSSRWRSPAIRTRNSSSAGHRRASDTVMFARTDRLPAWVARPTSAPTCIPSRSCAIRRQMLGAAPSGSSATSPDAGGTRCSIRRSAGVHVSGRRAAVLRGSSTRERLDRVFGVAVNLEWARDHYFNDILQQVAQIAGNASASAFAVIDERGRSRRAARWTAAFRSTRRDARVSSALLRPDAESRSIHRPISRSGRGRSPRARPAIRRSCWPRAERGGASSSSARASRSSRSASSPPPAPPARAPPSPRCAPTSSPRSRTS